MDPPLPPLLPIDDNNYESGNVVVASSNSTCRLNTIMVSETDVFFYSSPLVASSLKCIFLRDSSPIHPGKITVASRSSLSNDLQAGAIKYNLQEEKEVTASGVWVHGTVFFWEITHKTRTNTLKHTQQSTMKATLTTTAMTTAMAQRQHNGNGNGDNVMAMLFMDTATRKNTTAAMQQSTTDGES